MGRLAGNGVSPSTANLNNGDNKHVVINRDFAEDESSILSTSNLKVG